MLPPVPSTQRISVAMCTFNGSAFVDAQLNSIARQTRRPDELIVCDDCSTDDTLDRVTRFKSNSPFPVTLVPREQTLGPTANFDRAISLCTGTLIALADQDDMWEPNKIARLESEFRNGSNIGYVFSDAEVIDSTGKLSNYRLWESIGFEHAQQKRFHQGDALAVLSRENVVTGATLMFRTDLRALLLPLPKTWVHDGWMAAVLSCVSRGIPVAEPLVRYRTHPSQLIGAKRRTLVRQIDTARSMDLDYFTRLLDGWQVLRQRLVNTGEGSIDATLLRLIDEKIHHATRRRDMRIKCRSERVRPVWSELISGRYAHYSLGWKSVLQDLFL